VRVHVDNLKISSGSKSQLDKVVRQLEEVYGEITEHDYLGMILYYHQEDRKISLNMLRYIATSIEHFKDDNSIKLRNVSTPAMKNLFQVRDKIEREILTENFKSQFHATVAKLLFVMKRGRQDILLAVSFLTTRVQEPDMDDWKKLIRILGYLKGTLYFELIISCKNLNMLTWYIYGLHAVHQLDMKGQSGAFLMIGDSTVLSRSNKQKINTRSLTEMELIAVDDTLPLVQWTAKFMKDQGYDLNTIVKEDNKSSILLMKNGR